MDKRARHELARQKGHLSINPFKDRKLKLLLLAAPYTASQLHWQSGIY